MSDERNYKTEDFDLVDLYTTHNAAEAFFIKDMLDANDIASFIRDMEISAFPMSAGEGGEHRLVVEDDKLVEAAKLIELAIEDGAITNEGNFLHIND